MLKTMNTYFETTDRKARREILKSPGSTKRAIC